MAMHIPDMIKDFRPPHLFWYFSFERMNGVLSGFPNSNHHIEQQLFTKFLKDVDIRSVLPPDLFVTRWSHLDDILPFEWEVPSLAVHPLLLDFCIKYVCHLCRGQVWFTTVYWQRRYYCVRFWMESGIFTPSRLNVQITRDFYLKLPYFYEHLYEVSSISLLPCIEGMRVA